MPDADRDASSGELPLAGRTVLAVFAHPDDESLACGGTLARLADAGARVVLLCASRGESGRCSDPSLVAATATSGASAPTSCARPRAVLGIADVIMLDHPDGDLRWADVPELHAEIVAAIRATGRTRSSRSPRTGCTGISITSASTNGPGPRCGRSAPTPRRSTT